MYYLVFKFDCKNKPDLLCLRENREEIIEDYKYFYNSYTNLEIIEADSIDNALKIYASLYGLKEV